MLARRRFLRLLLTTGGLVGLGCQPAATQSTSRSPAATPTSTPSLAFPKPAPPRPTATPLPTLAPLPPGPAGGADEQSRVIPALQPRPGAFATRSLPPERLIVPRIELDARVIPLNIHPDQAGKPVWETAPFAVGHHFGSNNPGEPGNVVLSGHISSPREGAVSHSLPQIKPGDGLILATAEQNFLYRVRDVSIVAPTAIELLAHTPVSIATLITCYPDGIYSQRLIVRAEAV